MNGIKTRPLFPALIPPYPPPGMPPYKQNPAHERAPYKRKAAVCVAATGVKEKQPFRGCLVWC
jgi:hypothetical protein